MATVNSRSPELLSFCALGSDSLNTITNAPTPALVQTLLDTIASRLQEKHQQDSEWLKSKVQLETTLNKHDTQNRNLKASLDQAKSDATQLRRRLQEAESGTSSLKEEYDDYKKTSSASKSTLTELNSRIESLEASNREKLALLDSKTTSYDNLVNDLNAQYQKTVDLRKQLSANEQTLEHLQSELTASTYREQSQKQSSENLERRNEYLDSELKVKAGEVTKLRKDKNQEVSRLERQNEDATAQIRQLQNVEGTLRRTIEELNEKAEERSLRVEELQQEFLQKETSYQLEIDAANRLAKLREDSSKIDRQRVLDLTQELDDLRHRSAQELSSLQAELETEHSGHDEAETKIAELEVQIERLNDEVFNLKEQNQQPGTPLRAVNGLSADHGDYSPQSQSPGSIRTKGGLSVTRLYSENSDLKRQVMIERRKNEELSEAMTGLVMDMENQAPEIEDLKTEHARLEGEVSDLSILLDTAGKERDQATKAAKKHQGEVGAKIREGEILRQQLRDLSSQMKLLLLDSQLRDQGRQNLGIEERAQLEKAARYNADELGEGLTDTDKFISTNLVQFRNILELQEQNSNLLKLTRELGDRMEREESLRTQAKATQNWDELQQKYDRCREEMKSLVTQSQSYIRERDMFRTMLENRGQSNRASEFAADDYQTRSANDGQIFESVEANATNSQADYAKLVKDLQAHFDAYKEEAATDRAALKRQIDDLLRAQSDLRSEAARHGSQATLSRDRYEMLQTNYGMLKSENSEMQKRFQESFESSAKQDLRVQQAAEDLVETRGLLDSMRNETANLKAEKEFWKTIETRLNDDNNSLVQERSRLGALNASLQSLINEREHSESETRRRLQAQVDSLETDIQSANSNSRQKEEDLKQLSSRREFESTQNQKRIDDLMTTLTNAKEDAIRATTAKEHLSRKADELAIELRSANERLDALKSSPTPNTNGVGANVGGENGPSISSEQELKVQISELNKQLALGKAEIEDLKSQVEQYKAISQESEDELSSLNQTHDLYRQEMDGLIQEKASKLQEQEQRLADVSKEFDVLNGELAALRNTQAANDRTLQEQRREFDVELAKLKDQDERHAATAQYYQQDLKAQASIAQQAQQNYENELVKHADAAKALQKARNDLNDLKMELVGAKKEAETSRLNQTQNEDSWSERKERFEREVGELRNARQDLKTQNDLLHQQIETLSQASKRTHHEQDDSAESSALPANNLQEIIGYLRREKDIVDVQLELATQEAKRLKQQLNHAQAQLDDARLKLQQQNKVEAETANAMIAQRKLMETVQDLNTHREANVTLRAETRLAQAGLVARTREVEELRAQIEPLQNQVQELKGEREALADDIKYHKDTADQWQQRAQNVLQKYDRVDPAELEALKQKIITVEAERNELVSTKDQLQVQLEEATAQIALGQSSSDKRVEDLKARLGDQFKARSKAQSDKIREKDSLLQTATAEKHDLEERLALVSGLQEQLDAARIERDAAIEKLSQAGANPDPPAQKASEEGEVDEAHGIDALRAQLTSTQSQLDAAEAKLEAEKQTTSGVRSELSASRDRITELEVITESLRVEIAELRSNASVADNIEKQATEPTNSGGNEQSLFQSPISIVLANTTDPEASKSLTDQVAKHVEAARVQLQQLYDERVQALETDYKNRVEKMKGQLNDKLAQGRARVRESLVAEHEQKVQGLKSQHDDHVAELLKQHQQELSTIQESKSAEARQEAQEDGANQSGDVDDKAVTAAAAAPDDRQAPGSKWVPTDEEARAFLSANEAVKRLVRQSIQSNLTKQVKKKDEEHQKALAEALSKANTAKDHAVMMEGKKSSVQLNMAQNRLRGYQFKVESVQAAAQETPQKAVKEVWDSVKDAKPPQPVAQPGSSTVAKAAVTSIDSVPQGLQSGVKPSGNTTNEKGTAMPDVLGTPASQPSTSAPAPAAKTELPSSNIDNTVAQNSAPQSNPFLRPLGSGTSQTQQPAQNVQQNTGSRIPAAAGSIRGSGLPVARGNATRGMVRGRGGGPIRGGAGVETVRGGANVRGRASPTRGAMNPSAQQFVPGNKRPRDESQEGGDGPEKKIKGGGAS